MIELQRWDIQHVSRSRLSGVVVEKGGKMPRLDNPRHELYAQGIAKGKSQRQAYLDAGYEPSHDNSCDAAASALVSDIKVTHRVAELQEAAANRVEITVETLCAKLETVMKRALLSDQNSAAVAAIMGQGKLTGLLVDKVKSEISGKDGVPLQLEGRDLARRIAMTLAMGADDKTRYWSPDRKPDPAPDSEPSEGEHVH